MDTKKINRCIICRDEFEPDTWHPNAETCSRRCSKKLSYDKNKKLKSENIIEQNCRYCEEQFMPSFGNPDQKFCCGEHQRAYFYHKKTKQEKEKFEKEKLERTCLFCDESFVATLGGWNAKYCCSAHGTLFRKYRLKKEEYEAVCVQKVCLCCGDSFKPAQLNNARKYCLNQECQNERIRRARQARINYVKNNLERVRELKRKSYYNNRETISERRRLRYFEKNGFVGHEKYSREELLAFLVEQFKLTNKTPSIIEIQKNKKCPSHSTFKDRFGCWNAAIKEAGLTPNEGTYGNLWRLWESHCRDMAQALYGAIIVHNKSEIGIPDIELPELKKRIDAKTSGYNLFEEQTERYASAGWSLEFWCIWKVLENNKKNVRYFYADELAGIMKLINRDDLAEKCYLFKQNSFSVNQTRLEDYYEQEKTVEIFKNQH